MDVGVIVSVRERDSIRCFAGLLLRLFCATQHNDAVTKWLPIVVAFFNGSWSEWSENAISSGHNLQNSTMLEASSNTLALTIARQCVIDRPRVAGLLAVLETCP